MKRENLHGKVPGYRVELEPSARRVRILFAGEPIADSRGTLVVKETKHADVVYFPREDVRMEALERSDHRSFCPFKGEACYWSFGAEAFPGAAEAGRENAVWSYEAPFPEVAGLKDYVSFYPDRVEWRFD